MILPQHLNRGFPQGSILGPLLFSLEINDCPQVIRHSKCHLYADDLQIYLESSTAYYHVNGSGKQRPILN